MKRTLKTVFSLLLVMVLVLSFSATAQAEAATVTFTGKTGCVLLPGSDYTDTDLFDGFKNVMPGDILTQDITIRNTADGCDYIKVYLKAVPHDESNPLTYSETFENTDGNDQKNEAGQRDETVATMTEFLKQLNMTVKNGESVIFEGTPDVAGGLANNVLLGQLNKGQSLKLTVQLSVPITMGNEFAHRVGEVDWVFLVEAYQSRQITVRKVWDDNGDPSRPKSVTVHLMRDGVKFDTQVLSEANQWTYVWDMLDDLKDKEYKGHNWTVREDVPAGYTSKITQNGNIFTITNSNDYEPAPEVPPIDLTVKKVWSDMNNKLAKRPGSVVVTLYDGTQAVEKVILSGANNWTYTWFQLDGTHNWAVQESVPLGYKPYYIKSGNVVTITNMVTLIQTGQLNWPIPVLGSLGALLVLFGAYMMLRKRKNKNA